MIYELTVRSSKLTPVAHWDKVVWLKGKKVIEFKPGINIVYGPNGTGKSTLLSALAKLMHCYRSNWPVVNKDSLGFFTAPSGRMLDGLMLEHDGSPCRYLGTAEADMAPDHGVTEHAVVIEPHRLKDGRQKAMDHMSHGQATITKLARFLKAEPEKVRMVMSEKKCSPEWLPIFHAATESLFNVAKRKDCPKQQVVLLDEVDRSLDFTKQASVWKQVRLLAEDNYQIIIASHSPWAAVQPNANYIETTPGYLDRTRKALGVLLQNLGDQG